MESMRGGGILIEGDAGAGRADDPGSARRRPRPIRPFRAGLLASLAGALLAVACAPSASAVIVRLGHNHAFSYQPVPGAASTSPERLDSIFHNLDYNGGRVMTSNTNYTFYWNPSGAPAYPADYQPGLKGFFEDLAHDSGGSQNVDSVSSQYNDHKGAYATYDSHFGGAIVDTSPYPATGGCTLKGVSICIEDHQIKQELAKYLKAHGLPMDLSHEYFVLLPPGVESCLGAYCSAGIPNPERQGERESFCAYHGAAEVEGLNTIVYADDPYVAGGRCDDANHPNGTTADATISGGLSHEHVESITDPVPNKSWTDWATGKSTGYEIGDKCRTFNPETEFGTPLGTAANGAKYNQVINGHAYWFQQEWSNQGHRCLQRYTPSGKLPTASYTWTADTEEFTADASASTAEGGVSAYEWQMNEYEGQPPTTSCGPGSAGPICKWGNIKGVHDVALTVYASDGASAGTAHWINVGKIAIPKVTKVTPGKGPVAGGTKVTIIGSEFVPGEETVVRFGSTPAASFTVDSLTKITAIAPAAAAGTVDVTVTTLYGTTPTSAADRYRYGPPIIAGVSPKSGSKAGGTSVTVTGAGFQPGSTGTTFKIGKGLAIAVSCASTSECTFTTPPSKTVGTVDVIATVNGLSSVAGAADHYTYN
jgi:hypothetical protein